MAYLIFDIQAVYPFFLPFLADISLFCIDYIIDNHLAYASKYRIY